MGLSDTVRQRWEKALVDTPGNPSPGQGNPDAEDAALRREGARLQQENAVLNKAGGLFTSPPR